MFQVKNLTILHKKDLTPLIEGLSFSLAPGARAAVIGEEGNGKSTLLKLLYSPALVEGYAEWSGEILGGGLRRGYLAQELPPARLALPLWQFCADSPGFAESAPRAQADAARQLGLPPELFWDSRPVSSLSGGERVRLRLALLLLDQPDLLLLDEPSNDLDLAALGWLERFLLHSPAPVLYVSHDETLLARTANQIIHLERLRRRSQARCTVARAGYGQYTRERQQGFARQQQAARKERAELDAKLARYRQIRDKVEHQQNTITRQDPHGGRLLKKKMHSVLATGRRFAREEAELTALPEWEEAIFASFDARRAALPAGKAVLRYQQPALAAGGGPAGPVLAQNLRLWVTGPEHIGIVGANGAGKSTLLKELAGRPAGGLYAAGLRRRAAAKRHPGAAAGPGRQPGGDHPGAHPVGQHEVQGRGDGAPGGHALGRAAGKAAVFGHGAAGRKPFAAGRTYPQFFAPLGAGDPAGAGGVPRRHHQRLARPALPGRGLYPGAAAGQNRPARAAAGGVGRSRTGRVRANMGALAPIPPQREIV